MGKINYVSPYVLEKGKESDSGYDLRLQAIKDKENNVIESLETVLIHTGVYLELPDDIEVQLRPKSSLSSKGLLVHFGTVDSGYRGELLVAMTNLNKDKVELEHNRKIAQIVFNKKTDVDLEKVNKINKETDRGEGGFGSTGKF
ncbi:MAG: dUTP diphosphatase [Peptoniphilus rhinitidis]|uniref:dUTP diphosphatase n=1 Tax=Peptoniphilus rhinitidis TaxID=1175452 RepID=UPI002901153B|nr:dUTP diphosphatase [Peptoniphilus rhinitidis]MDU2108989.1 dUTP diphosphatase [Peptoniphilus lacydonensis]MDU3750160.1 dUTP diphosphatase [Peptoniphilus rhinitidis]